MTAQLEYSPAHSAIFHPQPRAFDPLALAISMSMGAAIEIAASWFYIWFYHEHNDLVARLLACAGFAGGVCLLCLFVSEMGEVSDVRIAALVALGLSLLALYFSWVFWLQRTLVLLSGPVPWWRVAIHPVVMVQVMSYVLDVGVWKYHDVLFRGPMLLIIWGVEAALIVIPPPIFTSRTVTRRTPKCIACRKQVERDGPLLKFSARDVGAFVGLVLARSFDALVRFARGDDDRTNEQCGRIDLKLYRCPRCDDTHLLHAAHVTFTFNRKGRMKRTDAPLVAYMVISAEQAEHVKSLHRLIDPDAADPSDESAGHAPATDDAASVQNSAHPQADAPVEETDDRSLGL